ncbi:MAG: hypothetical protein HY921_03395 [Elusimicrobia bacterium]|nr:hypothetical protein [Elusimicrobiota bacterium]
MESTLTEKFLKWKQVETHGLNSPYADAWKKLWINNRLQNQKSIKETPQDRTFARQLLEGSFVFRGDVPYIMFGAIRPGKIKPFIRLLFRRAGIDPKILHQDKTRGVTVKNLRRHLRFLEAHLMDGTSIAALGKQWADERSGNEPRQPQTYEAKLHKIIHSLVNDLWFFLYKMGRNQTEIRPEIDSDFSKIKGDIKIFIKGMLKLSKKEYKHDYFPGQEKPKSFEDACINIFERHWQFWDNLYIAKRFSDEKKAIPPEIAAALFRQIYTPAYLKKKSK